ncbi:MAG TPA: hypothetical protein VLH84_02210 [Patescibacteria group bacterium]|nr:hypothetical protein [Patescibacteria group bacterium]
MRLNLRLPNRDKTISELARRYDEAIRKSERGIHNDEEARQFISLLAHYVYYVKNSDLTKSAIESLFKQRELLAGDQALVDEADQIIVKMKIDRGKLVRYAQRRNIDVGRFEFNTDGVDRRITADMEPSYYLTLLNDFLNLPSDQQFIGNVPREISHLRSVIFALQMLSSGSRSLNAMRDEYRQVHTDYERKLQMQGVYLDYLRVEDYKALEVIWSEVYHEGDRDELIGFHLMYGHLFERHRNYSQGQQGEANEFVDKHITNLQRVHNYLIDRLEDIPLFERFLRWTVEHFGPTIISLAILFIFWWVLNKVGIHITVDNLKQWTGL